MSDKSLFVNPGTKKPLQEERFIDPGWTISRILYAPKRVVIIYLGDALLRRSVRATSRTQIAPRTLALAPERVCREPVLPPAEMRSRGGCPPPHRITFHLSSSRGWISIVSVALSLGLRENVWHVSIPSLAISRPSLTALHESAVTNGNGVRTFLPAVRQGDHLFTPNERSV